MVTGDDTHDSGEASVQARAEIVGRFRARRVEIDEAIFARVSDQWFDRTGSEDPEYVGGLRAAGVAALDYVLVGIERSGQSLEPVPAAVLAQARRAARTGVGLETVLRRYLAGYALLTRFVIQEAERGEKDWIPRIGLRGLDPAQPSVLQNVLAIVSALVDRLIAAVSRAYGEEIERAGHAVPANPARPGRTKMSVSAPRERTSQRGRTWRGRILEAIAEVAAERGFEHTSVKLVTTRAGVSTRTFYEEFDDLQDCFLAVLDLGLERAGELIARASASAREERWQDGVLRALASLLVSLDSEPLLARVWFVEAVAAGSRALERREQIAEALRSMIVEYWVARGEEPPDPVVAAGAIASVLGLIQTHLATEQPGPLIELLGPLMGLVTSLSVGQEDRAREVRRGAELAGDIKAGKVSWALPPAGTGSISSESALPAILTNPTARRLRACVLYLAEQGERGIYPSNREIGTAIGAVHKSQISKLLSRLQAEDLAVKGSAGPGAPNKWRLTPRGEEIAGTLAEQAD